MTLTDFTTCIQPTSLALSRCIVRGSNSKASWCCCFCFPIPLSAFLLPRCLFSLDCWRSRRFHSQPRSRSGTLFVRLATGIAVKPQLILYNIATSTALFLLNETSSCKTRVKACEASNSVGPCGDQVFYGIIYQALVWLDDFEQ